MKKIVELGRRGRRSEGRGTSGVHGKRQELSEEKNAREKKKG